MGSSLPLGTTARLLPGVEDDIALALGNQFGVGAEGGSQRVAHIMRRLFDSRQDDGDFVVCKFDLRNAFNTGFRYKILNAVAKLLPGLLPWASWLLVQESVLIFAGEEIASAEGVQQGDPLGPVFFACLVKEMTDELDAFRIHYVRDGESVSAIASLYKVLPEDVRRANPEVALPAADGDRLGAGIKSVALPTGISADAIREAGAACCGLEANKWYLDDAVLAGRTQVVLHAASLLRRLAKPLGLEVNDEKCELVVYPPGGKDVRPPRPPAVSLRAVRSRGGMTLFRGETSTSLDVRSGMNGGSPTTSTAKCRGRCRPYSKSSRGSRTPKLGTS